MIVRYASFWLSFVKFNDDLGTIAQGAFRTFSAPLSKLHEIKKIMSAESKSINAFFTVFISHTSVFFIFSISYKPTFVKAFYQHCAVCGARKRLPEATPQAKLALPPLAHSSLKYLYSIPK